MTTLLRVLRADAAAATSSCALATVVSAAGVAVVTVSDAAGVSVAGIALDAVGALALWGSSAAAVRRRAGDVALARLRGVDGPRLVWVAVAPLLLVVVLGLVVGTVAGATIGAAIARSWDVSATWPAAALLVPAVLALGAVAVVVATARSLRAEPLATTLAGAARPGSPRVLARFGQLLAVVVAVVALRQAVVARGWWVQVAVAATALAGGQLVAWAVPAVAARVRSARTLPGLLLARRMRRAGADTGLLRLTVAALAVLLAALAVTSAGAQWRDRSARLSTGAPVRYDLASPVAAYAAARRADPGGHWLMAAAWDADGSRVFLDRGRWTAVAGDFLPGVPAAGEAGDAHLFASTALELDTSASQVELTWVDQHNYLQRGTWAVSGRTTIRIGGCAQGCVLVSASPTAGDATVVVRADGREVATTSTSAWPVVTTAPVDTVTGLDGAGHPVSASVTTAGLPIVGTGVLADLGTALGASGAPATTIRAAVLARSDTPAAVLAAAGLSGPGLRLDDARADLDAQPVARAALLGLVAASGSALAGLVLLLQTAWTLRRERRHDVAALRAVGLVRATVGRAHRLEALTLAAIVAVGAALTTLALAGVLGARLVPVGGWAAAPAPSRSLPWAIAGLGALAALVLFTLAWARGLRAALVAGRPAVLRGAER